MTTLNPIERLEKAMDEARELQKLVIGWRLQLFHTKAFTDLTRLDDNIDAHIRSLQWALEALKKVNHGTVQP